LAQVNVIVSGKVAMLVGAVVDALVAVAVGPTVAVCEPLDTTPDAFPCCVADAPSAAGAEPPPTALRACNARLEQAAISSIEMMTAPAIPSRTRRDAWRQRSRRSTY